MSRLMDSCGTSKERVEELCLRPQKLSEYIGQSELIDNIHVYISAALQRQETLDHILIYGPPGLGKTTLANVIANEMGANIHIINGPSIEKTGDLASILSALEPGDILFIDEIHRLPNVVEEVLYGAMEDFNLSIVLSKDGGARVINMSLPPFTLIAATTRVGDLSAPLRARFGIVEKMKYYTIDELCSIVNRTAKVFNSTIDCSVAEEIAKRSRGTPRIANRLFKRVRDFANYEGSNNITKFITNKAFKALKVDSIGLDYVDLRYLTTLIERFKGGPVGLQTLANSIGEETMNLEDVYEPYLLQIGFIDRTSKGRIATIKAIEHLKKAKFKE